MINLILHFEKKKINYLNNLFIILMMHSLLSKFLIYFSQQYTFILLAIIIIKNKYIYLLTLIRRTTILDYTLLETYIFCNSLQMDYALNFIRRVPAVNKNSVFEIEDSYNRLLYSLRNETSSFSIYSDCHSIITTLYQNR